MGSEVSIRHVNTQGGYLHSHPHNYPGGSKRKDTLSHNIRIHLTQKLQNNKSHFILTATQTTSGGS